MVANRLRSLTVCLSDLLLTAGLSRHREQGQGTPASVGRDMGTGTPQGPWQEGGSGMLVCELGAGHR